MKTKRKGPKYDYTLKELFQRVNIKFFEMITGRNDSAEILNIELPAIKKRIIDLLIKYSDGSLYHFEIQTKNEKDFHFRMLEYAYEIKRRFGRCPKQYVIYIGEDLPRFVTEIDEEDCYFRYNIFDVKRDINCNELLQSKNLEDWIIAPLCTVKDKEKVIRELTERINRLSPKQQEDAFLKIEILLGLRKDIKEIFFREVPMPIKLKENYFYKEAVKEGLKKGKEEGLKEGKKKALQEVIVKMYIKKHFSPQEISDILEIPLEEVKKYLKDAGAG